jgi:hypothetical protein
LEPQTKADRPTPKSFIHMNRRLLAATTRITLAPSSKLPNNEIRRLLIFLFGENPNKTGNGITVFREKSRWRISFKGLVQFYHEIANGRSLFRAVKEAAEHYNKQAKQRLEQQFKQARQRYKQERVVFTQQT